MFANYIFVSYLFFIPGSIMMLLVSLPSPQAWVAFLSLMIVFWCTGGKIKVPVKSQEIEGW